ncbi:putative leucine-rich repeat-containing protein DDB_G0290503 [Hydractinia symbiolongicarpus]|uniref:putative leucine-rich repeat-containing protein DDB_G0290503 n=1 Tax=Hydractinia symbiolongicarpus TaxID=13093 RepID=UPI002550FAB2|nr:putative leucine-rich repeat-containing protein DDB_G0290503 [Hydractinia symbiolongicarpus]
MTRAQNGRKSEMGLTASQEDKGSSSTTQLDGRLPQKKLVLQPATTQGGKYHKMNLEIYEPKEKFKSNNKYLQRIEEIEHLEAVSCVNGLINNIEDKHAVIKANEEKIEEQKYRIGRLEHDLNQYKLSIAALDRKYSKSQMRAEKLDSQLRDCKSDVQTKVVHMDNLKKQLDDSIVGVESLTLRNKKLEVQISEAETHNLNTVIEYEKRFSQMKCKTELLEKEVQTSSFKLSELKIENAKKENKIQALEEKGKLEEQTSSAELHRLSEELDNIRLKLHDSHIIHEDLKMENQNLNVKLYGLQKERSEEKDRLAENVRNLNKEIISLKEKQKEMINNENIHEEVRVLMDKVKKDQEMLEQLKKDMRVEKHVFHASTNTMVAMRERLPPVAPAANALLTRLQESQSRLFETLGDLAIEDAERRMAWNNIKHEGESIDKLSTAFKYREIQRQEKVNNEDILLKSLSRSNEQNANVAKENEILKANNVVCREENTKLAETIRKLEQRLKETDVETEKQATLKIKIEELTYEMESLQRKIERLEDQKRDSEHCINLLNNDIEHYRRASVTLQNSSKQCCHWIKIKNKRLEERLMEMEEEHQYFQDVKRKYHIMRKELLKCKEVIKGLRERIMAEKNETDAGNVAISDKHIINLQVHVDKDEHKKQKEDFQVEQLKEDLNHLHQQILLLRECKEKDDSTNGAARIDNTKKRKDQTTVAESHITSLQKEMEEMQKEILLLKEKREPVRNITDENMEKVDGNNTKVVINETKSSEKIEKKEELFKMREKEFESLQLENTRLENEMEKLKESVKECDLSREMSESKYKKKITDLQAELDQCGGSRREEIDLLNLKIKDMNSVKQKNENVIRNLKEQKDELQMNIRRMEREIANFKQKLDFVESNRKQRDNAEYSEENNNRSKKCNEASIMIAQKETKQTSDALKKARKPIWMTEHYEDTVGDVRDGYLESKQPQQCYKRKNAKEESGNSSIMNAPMKSFGNVKLTNQKALTSNEREAGIVGFGRRRNIPASEGDEESDENFLNIGTPIRSTKTLKTSNQNASSFKKSTVSYGRRKNSSPCDDDSGESGDDFLNLNTPIKPSKNMKPFNQKDLTSNRSHASNMQRGKTFDVGTLDDNDIFWSLNAKASQSSRQKRQTDIATHENNDNSFRRSVVKTTGYPTRRSNLQMFEEQSTTKAYIAPGQPRLATNFVKKQTSSWSDDEEELIAKCLTR